MKRSPALSDPLTILVIFFAIWTVFCHLAVFSGASLNSLTALALLALLAAIWTVRKIIGGNGPGESAPEDPALAQSPRSVRVPGVLMFIAAAVITGLYAWTASYLVFYCLATGFLILALLGRQWHETTPAGEPERPAPRLTALEKGALALLVVCAVVVTLVAHRADKDDSYYMNVVVSALDHPDRQLMLKHDHMYGEENLPSFNGPYRVHPYELLLAVLSHLTRVPPGFFYYLLFPTLFAVLVILVHVLALGQLAGRGTVWGAWLVFIVLVTWGDVFRSYGNFSFVRLYQGKAVLVSILIPAVIYYACVFTRTRTRRSGLLLFASQLAAVGFSATALVTAPLAAATVLLGSLLEGRNRLRLLRAGFVAILVIVLLGGTIMVLTRHAGHGLNPRRYPSLSVATVVSTAGNGLRTVGGNGLRAYLALFCLLVVSVSALPDRRRKDIAALALGSMVLVFNPVAPFLAGMLNHTLTWRLFWSVPMPLFVGLAGIGFWAAGPRIGPVRTGTLLLPVLALAFLLAGGRWTLSHQNYVRLGMPGYKVDDNYRIAQRINRLTGPRDLVLAPWGVSVWVPTLRHHPRLVGVRPMHLGIIKRAMGKREARLRRQMMDFVSGVPGSGQWLSLVVREIARLPVALIVFRKDLPWRGEFEKALARLGYTQHEAGGFRFWQRSERSPAPSRS